MSSTPLTSRTATVTVLAQAAARGVSLLLVIVSTSIVARTLGVGEYADWVTVLSLVALFGFLLDPSISPVVVRRLAQDPAHAPTPAGLLGVRLALGCGALVLIALLAFLLRGTDALVLAVALGGQVIPRSLVLNATPWLQSDHRLHRLTALEVMAAALGLAGLATCAALDAPAWVLGVAGFGLPTALLAIAVRREVRRTPSSRVPPPGPQRERVRSVLREAAPLAVALALTAAYTRVNTIFVNVAEESADVAKFLFAFLFVEQIIVVGGIVAGALLPMLAVRARGADLLRSAATGELQLVTTAIGALFTAALLALATPLVAIIGGPTLEGAERYLQLLSPMGAILLGALLMGSVYLAAGFGRRYLRFALLALVFNVVANAALSLTLGAGATARIAWATELLVVVLATFPLVRSGGAGAAAAARAAALVAVAIAAAELTGNDVIAPALGAAGVVVAVIVLAGTPLRRVASSIVSGG